DTEDARDEHAGDSAEPQDGPDDDPDGGPDSPGGGQDSPEGRGTGRTGTPAPSSAAPPRWEVPGVGEGAPGRRSRAQTRQGRMVRPDTGTTGGLHLLGTVFAAAPH
ncbi:magnesium chelatase, partial [Nocardia cyriacigeorgica]|nr:magnesium chelatase [Nocardia cyriacigeorgica]